MQVLSSPTLSADGSVVYVGSNDNSLYAVNMADGSKKWAFATGGHVSGCAQCRSVGAVYIMCWLSLVAISLVRILSDLCEHSHTAGCD